ncbi:MAG TPA: metal-sulfur cluster assembly factor [Chloroflexi bacterium]|nr:metal-sulfur cluster assembly factor [Chloroflexota bacterium]
MSEERPPLSEQEVQRIREALKEVYDPEIGLSVVDLGLVRKIEEVEGEVHITMILTAPFCPLANMILEQARVAAQAVTDRPVRVTLGTERWDPSMMAEEERQRLGFS